MGVEVNNLSTSDASFVTAMTNFRLNQNDNDYRVSVAKMTETHQITYIVCLDQPDRHINANPWDDGRITPSSHVNKDHAISEANSWAQFLKVKQITITGTVTEVV